MIDSYVPRLFQPEHWQWAQVNVRYWRNVPDDRYIQSVHVVCLDDDRPGCVVIGREADGPYFVPGGTREINESVTECANRELSEEVGVSLQGEIIWFGAHVGRGYKATPYRPHLPHPQKAWLWGIAKVRITSAPTNPTGAEVVTDVRSVSVLDAKRLLSQRAPWYEDLLDDAISAFEKRSERTP